MKIEDFKLEKYFAKYEFNTQYLLSISDCDGYSLKYVLDKASDDEISLWENLTLGYTEAPGSLLLRKAICQYYKGIDEGNVLVASPGELNFSFMNVLLDSHDHVIVVSPCYQSLYEVAQSIGCATSYWHPNSYSGNFDVSDLVKLIKFNTKLIVINFPHNPTGAYLTRRELNKIVDIAREQGIYIFSDEMYHKLIIADVEELPPISDIYEKGISLWGTSKTFALAGLRIGWIVSRDKILLEKILAFKDYLSICNSATSEVLALIALNNFDKFVPYNINKIKNNIALFKNCCARHHDILTFIEPKAGSTAVVQLNINETSLEFSEKLIEQEGVMTVPAEIFGFKGKNIRVGFGRDNFPEAIERFEHFLIKYK
ncbi:aminotransferase class I/II-fold pyridoxal phosphate-dependent enzyme [Shewanella sp. YLB-07]|uniref:aminotransferase class I/II-fold pyridoxal phosphate-dependent enzyme n=1 Tax=Shewanella sp. YLB-07 TaxID=2601268 RepID=UPI00128D71CC|nr:aminotransferase class I/II-fold pyridoxal phosphate-dependent enzyme [Shewanella sp. YLB-07]MPY24473.1 aminotransferase class I/II-fold pyridoxal phosphate-dependent enzyme [Shewanella sp. YLB-07]